MIVNDDNRAWWWNMVLDHNDGDDDSGDIDDGHDDLWLFKSLMVLSIETPYLELL